MTGLLAAGITNAPAKAQTIARTEVEQGDAMRLADRLLPPEIHRTVVGGSIRRQFIPGTVFDAWYRTAPRVAGPDLCERTEYRVTVQGGPVGIPMPDDSVLTIRPPEKYLRYAIVYPAHTATARNCAASDGFVSIGTNDRERQLAAYRRLIATMRAAKAGAPLPMDVRCGTSDEKPACTDSRKALAALPLDALFRIDIDSGISRVLSRMDHGVVTQQQPVESGAPYAVELSFGPSGDDYRSWRLSWREDDTARPRLLLARHAVIYH
ncbi:MULTISPECIES: hypothetical protein [unclassified Sphingomonas]|uniref:hypothetical protein n=1 Tax=unclassified Sphingomonas TaxID=196159 RepID=UPI0006FDAC8A|nr:MULTISPECIES: hypothetical protein [unclassified Sphingomonas]KQM98280.1 hypothetical protein ASE78_08550 [Sphingomonas sp. Leaf25]